MVFITIPARDEERTIGVLLWKLRKVMAEFNRPYEVIVLDDASRDGTPEVLERYRGLLPLHVESFVRSLVDSPTNSNPSSQE